MCRVHRRLAQGGGVAAGAATGAVGGAVVGGPIGAAVGGVAGAIVGGIADQQQPQFRQYVVTQKAPSYAYATKCASAPFCRHRA